MQRVRYELDPQNRLILRKSKSAKGPARYRQVSEGMFRIGPHNSLLYEAKTSGKIKFTGTWSLTDNHDLKLTLDRSELQPYRDELILKGEIVDAEANSLLFAVTTKSEGDKTTTRILTLKGAWQADENNRLIFKVTKEVGSPDSLVFEGSWEVNKSNEIVYKYTRTYLKRKEKLEREIIFRGHWRIIDNYRLIYALDLKGNSAFEFKLGVGSRILPKENSASFEIGAGLKHPLKARAKRSGASPKGITLYGKWRLNRPLDVSFEASYNVPTEGRRMELVISKKLLKGEIEPYIKFMRSKEESQAQIGAALRW